jgi:hypothetical protein
LATFFLEYLLKLLGVLLIPTALLALCLEQLFKFIRALFVAPLVFVFQAGLHLGKVRKARRLGRIWYAAAEVDTQRLGDLRAAV